jgi:hypothetical protein
MTLRIGVIGGSGLYQIDGLEFVRFGALIIFILSLLLLSACGIDLEQF